MLSRPKPIVLCILDGWGIAPPGAGNAITLAKTPNMIRLWDTSVHTQLIAHGESVGLPKREPGNTETGHMNLGAGRIVYQDLPRINMSIADGSFFQNVALLEAVAHVKKNKSRFHLLGLVGGGGVHSDITHLFALLRFLHDQGITDVYIHAITDGRDSPPTSAMVYIKQLQTVMARENIGVIGSVSGRYYAMDRDFRWDRTAKEYFCLTSGKGKTAPSIDVAVSQAYSANQTDEFIEPTLIDPKAIISAHDAVVFFNFRIDRPRQLTKAFVLPDFENTANTISFDPYAIEYMHKHIVDDQTSSRQKPFERGPAIPDLYFVTMTEYETGLPAHVAYPPQTVDNPLGRVISDSGLKQLHASESEKERFVTYYFNGLKEDPFPGEDRLIVPSPKVPTYDKKPEMSARELTDKLIVEIKKNMYDFIVVNYANADMVGHTGNIVAATQACEHLDSCIADLSQTILQVGGALMITADHGNAEEMINLATSSADTEHNANPVPFILNSVDTKATQVGQGILADVAPTILSLLQIPIPVSMVGRNLIG